MVKEETGFASVPSFRLDQNSLSNPDLIEQLASLGFHKQDSTINVNQNHAQAIQQPISEMSTESKPSMSPEEMLDYLKANGLVHGKVKLKTDAENEPEQTPEPTQTLTDSPELNNAQNETGATA